MIPPLLALLLAATLCVPTLSAQEDDDQPVDRSALPTLKLVIDYGGRTDAGIPFKEEFLQTARNTIRTRALGDQESSSAERTWNSSRVVDLYFDNMFHYSLQEAARTSKQKKFSITLVLNDGSANPKAPHVLNPASRVKRMVLGAYAIKDKSTPALKATLAHEAGHLGDDALCPDVRRGYGQDGAHYLEEITSPAAAFYEGWGWLQTLIHVQEAPQIADAHYLGGPPLVDLFAERPDLPDPDSPLVDPSPSVMAPRVSFQTAYAKVPRNELTLLDFVSNEAYVANVLFALTKAASSPADREGPQRVKQAFIATEAVECRSLYTFLGSYTKSNPARRADALRIVKEWSTVDGRPVGSDQAYEKLVDGLWEVARPAATRPRPSYGPRFDGSVLGQ